MYRLFARLYPKGIRKKYAQLLAYANIKYEPDKFIGFFLIFGIILGFVVGVAFRFFFDFSIIYSWAVTSILFVVLSYMFIMFDVDKKSKQVENNLPDALQLMSSNLRAGMTVDRALLTSARPEFGALEIEIKIVGRELATGTDFSDALKNMSSRIKSEKLEKVVTLITSGIRSGGELAALLDQSAQILKNQSLLDQKVRTSVLMYVIFIFAAVAFAAPILYGLSSFLVEVLTKILSEVQLPTGASLSLPISFTEVSISVSFVMKYIIVSLISSSIMSGFIIGEISKGRAKEGFKFIPLLILMSILFFFFARFVISSMFGDLFVF